MCVCVECGHTCVYWYIKLTFRLHHARHSCSVFTTLWCGCSVVKLTLYLHQNPSWLWLVWTNSPVFTPPGYRSVGTTAQIMPRLHRIMDTHQFLKYPDSTVLKWRIITMLNRKLLEKQRVQNYFASYEVHIGHLFYNVKATVSFGNRLTLSISSITAPQDAHKRLVLQVTEWLTALITISAFKGGDNTGFFF